MLPLLPRVGCASPLDGLPHDDPSLVHHPAELFLELLCPVRIQFLHLVLLLRAVEVFEGVRRLRRLLRELKPQPAEVRLVIVRRQDEPMPPAVLRVDRPDSIGVYQAQILLRPALLRRGHPKRRSLLQLRILAEEAVLPCWPVA